MKQNRKLFLKTAIFMVLIAVFIYLNLNINRVLEQQLTYVFYVYFIFYFKSEIIDFVNSIVRKENKMNKNGELTIRTNSEEYFLYNVHSSKINFLRKKELQDEIDRI